MIRRVKIARASDFVGRRKTALPLKVVSDDVERFTPAKTHLASTGTYNKIILNHLSERAKELVISIKF